MPTRASLTARRDLSANLTLHLPGDRAEFSVYGRNLLDTSNEGFVQDAFDYTLRALLEGRSIGVQAKFRFDDRALSLVDPKGGLPVRTPASCRRRRMKKRASPGARVRNPAGSSGPHSPVGTGAGLLGKATL